MKINRDDFLKKLESVQFGVPPRESVAFSKSFLFQDGKVFSYDDEILCTIASGLEKDITGAVEAQRLLGILRKIPDAQLELTQKNGEFILSGLNKKTYLHVEKLEGKELPSDQVEKPTEGWEVLPHGNPNKNEEDFGEAIGLVQGCAKEKDTFFSRTCVHITPTYMEAYDNFQMIRYQIKTKLRKKPGYVLMRKEAVKHISTLGMNKISETDNWVHFKSRDGLFYSCRRFLEEYPDLSPYFNADGEKITFPKGLETIIDRANEFSQELADANRVKVEIKKGEVRITGRGITGRQEEWQPLDDYRGSEYAFLISPSLLINIVKKDLEVKLSEDTLIVEGPSWKYLAVLVNPDEVDVMKEEDEDDEESSDEEQEEGDE